MSTTVEKISSNKVKLSFDIDAAKFDEAMGKAYIKVRGQIAIPGFRKGHAPRKMIENMYGEGVFYDEAFELIFDEVYGPAIDENKLEVVDRPQVDIQQIGAGKNLQFTCEVFVKPDVTLGEYKGVYHVLGGVISPIDGVFEDDLNIDGLIKRLDGVREVIIATNSDVKGEATAYTVAKRVKEAGVKVTRLAQGISMGSEVEYADEATLSRAIQSRVEM